MFLGVRSTGFPHARLLFVALSTTVHLTQVPPAHPNRSSNYHRDREEGFNSRFGVGANLTAYNALYDPNMRHFFESTSVQKHLFRTGQVSQ